MTIRSRIERLEAHYRPSGGVHTIVVTEGEENGPDVEAAARYAEENGKLLVVITNYYQPWPDGRAA